MHETAALRERVVGIDLKVPLYSGEEVVYTNLDNAASTPALKAVKIEADNLLEWYSSIHRGAGYKSQLASEWYERSRKTVLDFVNAKMGYHCVILTGNTTDAINRLARKLPRDNDKSVIISAAEHHANDLPWRDRGRVVRVPVSDRGEIDPDDLRQALENEGKRCRLVSLTGASNVVGTMQPIHEFARVAHEFGVQIAIDAAQLAPHVQIDMQGRSEEERIDFLFISGHKMYAPFGGGALIGPREYFNSSAPSLRGGGAVLVVEPEGIDWAGSPEREEAGSPNVIGAITLAASMRELKKIGFDRLEKQEKILTNKFLNGLKKIDGASIYGLAEDADLERRLGVVAFNLTDRPHDLVASILSHEAAIGVRNGCFCSHPFVMQLIGVSTSEARAFRQRVRAGDRQEIPGAVRVSFGLYNTEEEVDRVLALLKRIAEGKWEQKYVQSEKSGKFKPEMGTFDVASRLDRMQRLV